MNRCAHRSVSGLETEDFAHLICPDCSQCVLCGLTRRELQEMPYRDDPKFCDNRLSWRAFATPPPPADQIGERTEMIPTPAISGETAEGLEALALFVQDGEADAYLPAAAILREVAALKRAGVIK